MTREFSRRTLPGAALCGAALFSVLACGAEDDAAVEAAALESSSACEMEDGPLRIYVNDWGDTLPGLFEEDFGVDTEVADLGGGELFARVAAEANNPQWDVIVVDGHGSVENLRQQGLLMEGHELENTGNLAQRAQEMIPEGNGWVPVSEHAAAIIAYNTELLSEDEAPSGWEDLTDPAYAPIGIADPAAAAPAYPVVSWFFQDYGQEGAEEYFSTLIENGFNTYDRNGPVAQAVASGEVTTAMLQEHNVWGLLEDGEPVDFIWPAEGAPGAVRTATISAETPRPCMAMTFMDWLLTEETMSRLMLEGGSDSYITPYVEGADLSALPQWRPEDPALLITDAEFSAEQEEPIKDWFANAMIGG